MKTRKLNKRICIVRHYYYDLLVRREAETLCNAGFEVDVICLRPKSEQVEPSLNGVRMHYISLSRKKGGVIRYLFDYSSFFFSVFWLLTWLHLQRPFACIQVNNMPDFLVFATLVPRLLGSKVTMIMYEPTPELWATKYSAPGLIKLFEQVEQLSLRYAHAIFAVTEQMKSAFVKRGCPSHKIKVILNAPDSRFFKEGLIKTTVQNKKSFTLICHGAIEERYGHDTMLQAVKLAKTEAPHLRLMILGSGSYLNKFLTQIEELALEEYVQYLGFVPLPELVATLKDADAGIVAQKSSPYSNLVHTGKMYDYLNFGLPVIASRLRAVEAYFGADSLCFFEPGNPEDLARSIVELYQHPEKQLLLVNNSQYLYNQYKWDEQKKIYLSVYHSLTMLN